MPNILSFRDLVSQRRRSLGNDEEAKAAAEATRALDKGLSEPPRTRSSVIAEEKRQILSPMRLLPAPSSPKEASTSRLKLSDVLKPISSQPDPPRRNLNFEDSYFFAVIVQEIQNDFCQLFPMIN